MEARVGMDRRILTVEQTGKFGSDKEITIEYGAGWSKPGDYCFYGSVDCKNPPPDNWDAENTDDEQYDADQKEDKNEHQDEKR
jgi:hypothetical protein